MKRLILTLIMGLQASQSFAYPNIVETIQLGHSIVIVSTDMPGQATGRGSGVVVSKEYVATNCHILANANGVNIAKFRDGYQPIALKANWKRDLCLLKFDNLPLNPIPMRDSNTLETEEKVFSLSFPAGANVPQPSYGTVKATYPFQGAQIIRSDTTFTLGSSGGALFDENFNLIGITTFKSPGKQDRYFYSLPVEWIKELMEAPDTISLKTNDVPFWALPLEERPFFMQVVIPFQNKNWGALKKIAKQWASAEPQSADAWYFLGLALEGSGGLHPAKEMFKKAYDLNGHNLEIMMALSRTAYLEHDLATLELLYTPVSDLNRENGQLVAKQIESLK